MPKEKLDDDRLQRVHTYTDTETGLLLRCISVEYFDIPTVEWTLYFKNTGNFDTPILSDIAAIDTSFPAARMASLCCIITRATTARSFELFNLYDENYPFSGRSETLASVGGLPPTTGGFPYFNVEWPGGEP